MANTVSYSTSGGDHICTIAVADADTNGAVAFTVDFSDSAGNAGTQVTSATSGAVTIDTPTQRSQQFLRHGALTSTPQRTTALVQ